MVGKQLAYTLIGLHNLAPKKSRIKRPIFQSGQRHIGYVLELDISHIYRTLWVLRLIQWGGVMRTGYLLKIRCEDKRNWDPKTVTQRGRILL